MIAKQWHGKSCGTELTQCPQGNWLLSVYIRKEEVLKINCLSIHFKGAENDKKIRILKVAERWK